MLTTEGARAARQQLSLGLFGNKHKLDVLLAIRLLTVDGADDVYARQVSKVLPDAADHQVATIIQQLALAGLLIRIEDKSADNRHYYRVRDVSLWLSAARLCDELGLEHLAL